MKRLVIKEKQQLYKKMKYYKSFLYNNVEFTSNFKSDSEIEEKDLKGIIDALNIKNKSKRIEFMYDYLCEVLDDYYNGKDVCGFSDGKCLAQQFEGCRYQNGCCRLCKYQSSTGCTSANLTCKLYYCSKVKEKHKTIGFKDLKMLKLFSLRQRLIIQDCFFSSREEMLGDLKVGMVTFYAVRILCRVIRNLIYVRGLNNEKNSK